MIRKIGISVRKNRVKHLSLMLFLLTGLKGMSQVNDTVMVTVPAGEFEMGCNYNDPNLPCMSSTYPAHTVYLDEFKIDKYMVTYRRYNECIADSVCTELYSGAGCNAGMPWNSNHPVNCVDFSQAETFCNWEGKRLLTEAEWEKAARGTDGRIYPWGNAIPDCDLAVMNDQPFVQGVMGPGCGSGTTQPVGSKPNGVSPYGVTDMAGQLWEWTQDWYSETYFQNSPYSNPTGPSTGSYKVIKGGGGWTMRTAPEVVANIRFNYAPLGQGYVIGFRCAKSSNSVGVKENSIDKIKVHPNPTSSGVFTIEGAQLNKIDVLDSNGKVITRIKSDGNYLEKIDLSHQSSGVYFLKIYTDNSFTTKKLIIRK